MARKKKTPKLLKMDDLKDCINDIKIVAEKKEPLIIRKRRQRNAELAKNINQFIISNTSAAIKQDPFGYIKIQRFNK